SELARRIAGLPGAAVERPFAFEHDGVLLHGRLDVLHMADGRALVADYKTNSLEEGEPEELVERDYRLQRLVYALALLRGGAEEVEVIYQFLERPDALVSAQFARADVPALAAEHPDATIALRFHDDLQLLVSVILSAQTTDLNVNRVTERLFQKYRRPQDYLAVPPEELERDIYATGFFRQKTKALRGTMQVLVEEFDGRVPRRLEELLRLPGVARKTANVVAAELGEPQGIVVDTHVRRLSQRLGLTREEDPGKIERDLQRLVPRRYWGVFPHLLIWHGRRVCIARTPLCEACVVNDLCPSSRVHV